MTLLILGLALWFTGHLWNRFLPGVYGSMRKRYAYGVSLLIILTSLVLMVIGYRSADFINVWSPPSFFFHINNLLVLFAFYTYFATATPKGTVWLVGNLNHPQLTGFKIWAFAHLLVNGDLASIILFAGLLAWAVLEVILINRQGEKFDRSKAKLGRVGHFVLFAVFFVIVASVHIWLGVNPFGAR